MDDARMLRAKDIIRENNILCKDSTGFYQILSQGVRGQIYFTDANSCNCPDAKKGNHCKHMWAARYADGDTVLSDRQVVLHAGYPHVELELEMGKDKYSTWREARQTIASLEEIGKIVHIVDQDGLLFEPEVTQTYGLPRVENILLTWGSQTFSASTRMEAGDKIREIRATGFIPAVGIQYA